MNRGKQLRFTLETKMATCKKRKSWCIDSFERSLQHIIHELFNWRWMIAMVYTKRVPYFVKLIHMTQSIVFPRVVIDRE